MKLNLTWLFLLTAVSTSVQSGTAAIESNSPAQFSPSQTNRILSITERAEQIRAQCIQGKRCICGKILKVLPDGLVIESGYTNLLRSPLDRSWLLPGTVTASRATNLVESKEPDAVCIGLVFLSDLPKPRLAKAKQYDYVILRAFPAGEYSYTSVGDVHRIVRRFSYKLEEAVQFQLKMEAAKTPPATVVK